MKDKKKIESNELIERLPPHLKQFIKPQNYEDYTPINQAVWRYVMRKNTKYLVKVAHSSYIDGLKNTGIEIDKIPNMYGMNRILKKIGWAAVAVDGFIPPNAFMEFQAYKVLVIASDMRQLENIEYTPAPDIIHESAGHAPMIDNPDYAEYLRRIGDIGSKAIISKHDINLYEAVRKLSILKESDAVKEEEIKDAEDNITQLQNMNVPLSEMAKIRNLQWWSVEYGLVGSIDNLKIYGAGLLSSIGESKWCMSDKIKKLPYTINTAKQEFDITRPQPQLFITPNFSYLMQVLEEFTNTLSLRKGGRKGLEKLIESEMIGTIELNTGLQISGKFSQIIIGDNDEVVFFKIEGPAALAYREKELIGHGINTHSSGFSSPLGQLKNINFAKKNNAVVDLESYSLPYGKLLSFEFESGIKVEGINITGIRNIQGKLMIIQLSECTVTYKEKTLFSPECGIFDMALGDKIIAAFSGSADYNSFPIIYEVSKTLTAKQKKTKKTQLLEEHYRYIREKRENGVESEEYLKKIVDELNIEYPNEWLLLLEILEITKDKHLYSIIHSHLMNLTNKYPKLTALITEGLEVIESEKVRP